TGEIDLGNAQQGVEIANASGNTVQGTAQGAQVISGNQVGVEITGSTSTQNLVAGNFIGIDKTGTEDRGNSDEGVLIEGAFGNTVGGVTATARNVISANQWGLRIDGLSASGNSIEGNDIGTDRFGIHPLGNEINGVIISNDASGNSIGGTNSDQGNTIAFNVAAGVIVSLGTGDSILSNSMYSNGQQGTVLVATANHAQSAPTITGAGGGGTTNDVEGSLVSVPNTTFLIDFFSSPTPDPSGRGQGQNFLGSTTISTDSSGNGSISFDLATAVPVGFWVTSTATNQSTGDSSPFSNAIAAQAATVQFAAADVVVDSTAGTAVVNVVRSGNVSITVAVNYSATGGSATAGQDYTPASGTLIFPPNQSQESFTVPILADSSSPTAFTTVNLTLSQPTGGANLGVLDVATLIILNTTNPNVSSFVVYNTGDSGPGTLRAAILAADSDPNPGIDNILFDIPASIAGNLDVPVAGFDPVTQTWQISLASPLPVITRSVSIDGYSQGEVPVPFRYPIDLSSQNDTVSLDISVTGGTYQLTIAPYVDRSGTMRGGGTTNIPYDATGAYVQNQLESLVGVGNVTVTGQSQAIGPDFYDVSFTGESTGLAIDMQATNQLLVGNNPVASIIVSTQGGNAIQNPALISSVANTNAATLGNDSQLRVIINGSQITHSSSDTGFVVSTSDSSLRGLAITGFGVGVSVPSPADVGDLIQGNFIGDYLTYPVDPLAGTPLPAPNTVALVVEGNTQEGVVLDSANATVGGTDPQDSNVICGNGAQGVLIQPGGSGNQVLGNQIGVAGPIQGLYFEDGNGAEGVLIESSGTAGDPASIVYSSSNVIGGVDGGNVISANGGDGVHLVGVGATRNLVEANYIGAAPGGGYIFGSGDPGNLGDGVNIDDAPDNQIGGPSSSLGNVISSNQGNGVEITGADAVGNTIL
ncbi:MAG TPA: Calx-beta domain-containing protein, partial [Isosphaeraceae bacterium]|nr:Calx-beta domain-containing protein [Isosphaeraceae bacterium]